MRPSAHPLSHARWLVLSALLLAGATGIGGCGTRASVTLTSPMTGASLRPNLVTRVYTAQDENTVDVYLTDLTPEQLGAPFSEDPGTRPVGQIVHIHMFIRPSPGKTPIEPQASNCSIRHLILAPGATGLYGGGGFLLPSGSAASGTFGGSISAGTLRLQASTPTFHDALGPTEVRASFRIKESRELALTIARRLEEASPAREE